MEGIIAMAAWINKGDIKVRGQYILFWALYCIPPDTGDGGGGV